MTNENDAWVELPVLGGGGFGYHGVETNMGRLVSAHPRIGSRFMALFVETMFGEGVLDYQERKLVAAVAAATQDCFY